MIDELEAIMSEDLYWLLTTERRWPREKYEKYVIDQCLSTMRRYGIELD